MFNFKDVIVKSVSAVWLLLVTLVASGANDGLSALPNIQITLADQKDSAIQLEARQAPLAQILKEIGRKTGAIIHYSVLPEAPVTAICVGANVIQVLDCLAAKQIGMVAHKPQANKPAEIWLLGSSVGSCPAVTIDHLEKSHTESTQPTDSQLTDASPKLSLRQKSDLLLDKLRNAKTTEDKLDALTRLATDGLINDPNVRAALKTAATDSDARVRGAAISTLANLDKHSAAELLANAAHDPDPSVRMMAIDHAEASETDISTLKQALTDSDSGIREFAAAKLADIQKRQEKKAGQDEI
jgi:hypothetical protein